MFYRTTNFAIGSNALKYANRYNASIQKYQIQISSGVKIHRSSDNPIAFRQVSSLLTRQERLETEKTSINTATANLNLSVSQLTEANTLLVRAQRLAEQGVQATSEAERNALATEAESLMATLQTLAKTKFSGTYLYGGTRTEEIPYEFQDPSTDGRSLEVRYLGASRNSRSFINEAISLDTLFAGDTIFGDENARQSTVLVGRSGTRTGSGTDNVEGRATLQLRHTLTTYSGASGIAPGARSPGGDTLLGPAGLHEVVINDTSGTGAFGTISLNGGAAVDFTSADTDLEVVGKDGEIIYVDMSAITAGFTGNVGLTADGTLSIDDGASTTPIDFSSNQQVFDVDGEQFVNIDTTNTFRTGDDFLEFPGTADVFQAVYELVVDLRNDRGLDNKSVSEALGRRLEDIERLSDHLLENVGKQSSNLLALRQLEDRNLTLSLETETQMNDLQATDIPEAVLRLENDQALLQYTYAITAQINSLSLLNFLQ